MNLIYIDNYNNDLKTVNGFGYRASACGKKKNVKLQAKRLIEIADIKSRRNDLRKVIGYRNKSIRKFIAN